jgi:GDPmannose 4,6-dehydratase
MEKILATGVTDEDGTHPTKLLVASGHIAFGAYRTTSSVNLWRLDDLGLLGRTNLHLVHYDLTDLGNSIGLAQRVQPQKILHLAAQNLMGVSFEQPSTTNHITGIGVSKLLKVIRLVNPKIRLYQASTSEMFGKAQRIPQCEGTPFYPRSPYGVAKVYAHWMTVNYRESFGIFGASGILFNHKSPLRGREFVTRKITDSVAKFMTVNLDFLDLATSPQNGTGVSRKNTSRGCTACCKSISQTHLLWRRTNWQPRAILFTYRSAAWALASLSTVPPIRKRGLWPLTKGNSK